jgi:nicotinamide-nucleotide amidase
MSAADADPSDDRTLRELAEKLGRALVARAVRLAVAESCTGGWIAKVLTDIPGSSDWFDRGYVTYSNRAKIETLGVAESLLVGSGAVSEPVVRAMAASAKRLTGCEAAIAVSGIAGPGGASPGKPVGLVCFAFAVGEREWAQQVRFAGDREAVRRQAVGFALTRLTEALSH